MQGVVRERVVYKGECRVLLLLLLLVVVVVVVVVVVLVLLWGPPSLLSNGYPRLFAWG